MPQGRGCRARIRDPGRRQPSHLRRPLRRRHPARPVPPRAGRRPRGRGLREGKRARGRGARHERARRDQPGHPDRRRDDGQRADRVPHGPGSHRPDRHRRLSGGRHLRHHDADRQALDPYPGPARHPEGDPRGLPHRVERSAGAGAGGPTAGPVARRHPLRAGHQGAPARLSAHHGRQRQADPAGGQGDGELAPPRHLRRRRCDQRRRGAGVPRPLPVGQPARHLHVDGPGRLPGRPRAVARDARDARHPHSQLRDGRG